MKLRRRQLALFCAVLIPSICSALSLSDPSGTEINPDKLLLDARKNQDAKVAIISSTSSAIPQRTTGTNLGTRDAPVDGLDGKPHAGPFVDPLDSAQSKTTTSSTKNLKPKPKPEDGVMNDPNRLPPKEGTTGTEGGVSEKSRDRIAEESKTGTKQMKVPDSPKESPPVPAGERPKTAKSSMDDLKRQDADATSKTAPIEKGEAVDAVANLLNKPSDLPDRPHDIPHPDPIDRSKDGTMKEPKAGSKSFLTDVPSQAEGAHDLIPWDSFFGSFSSIAATEIGDKTFIVAALMAMRYPKLQVFSAAYSALFIMTILSGVAGHLVGAMISKRWSALVAAVLFLFFGAKSLREGFAMDPNQGVSDEMQEVEAELEEKEVDMARRDSRRKSSISAYALESGRAGGARRSGSRSGLRPRGASFSSRSPSPSKASFKTAINGIKNLLSLLISPAWVETFSMTFIGELGDRSQIATVAMAAGQEFYWVMVGACLGHFVCTAVAVLGGSVLAGRVSMRKVTLVGGGIFIFFGVFTLYEAQRYFF